MTLLLDRRAFIAVTGAAAMAGSTGASVAATPATMVIFDPTAVPARAFGAHAEALGLRTLAVSGDLDIHAASRGGFGLKPGERVVGVTRWADALTLRAALADTGRRHRWEMRVDCSGPGGDRPWPRALAEVLACDTKDMAQLNRDRVSYRAAGHDGALFAWVMG